MNVPKIEPIKVTEYETKQSTYPHCGKLPIRSIVLGPSGSGKTVLLTNLILDVYKGCFQGCLYFLRQLMLMPRGCQLKNTLMNMICVAKMRNVSLTIMIRKNLRKLLTHSERWFSI